MKETRSSDRIMNPVRLKFAAADLAAWRFFAGYYKGSIPRLATYAVVASAQSLLIIPVLYLVRYVFDVAIPTGNVALLIYAALGIVVIRAVNSAIVLGMRGYVVGTIKTVIATLRRDLIARLYLLSHEFHSRSDVSRIHTRVVQDTERLDTVSNAILSNVIPSALSGLVVLGVLFVMNWFLALLMIAVAPLIWLTAKPTGRLVRRDLHAYRNAFEIFSKGILFVLRQMELTRVQAHEAEEKRRQDSYIEDMRRTGEQMAFSFALHKQVQQNVTGIAGVIILVAGGVEVANGAMTVGAFLAFYVAAGILNGLANAILGGITDVISGTESLVTLHELHQIGPMDPYTGKQKIPFRGRIVLRDIVFDYGEHPVLTDVNLDIRPGAKIAIVGGNGSGKSTILNLIIGLAKPVSGSVSAEGISYDQLEMPSLRRQIGVVPQRATFFGGTILDNLTYGHPNATREEVIAAASVARAHEFISALAQGYDTQIGDTGHLLSGGECQRIAIARALLARPKLLILDEPTNHLDADTVGELMVALVKLDYEPTILMVSHDDRVVGFADERYRLENGRLTDLSETDGSEPSRLAVVRN